MDELGMGMSTEEDLLSELRVNGSDGFGRGRQKRAIDVNLSFSEPGEDGEFMKHCC